MVGYGIFWSGQLCFHMFVSQTSPLGVELFFYVNAFFCSHKFA